VTRLLARLTCAVLLLPALAAHGRDLDLDKWLDRELIPHVTEQLTQHPRFRGETILFVVLENDGPAPVTNSLALALRDRLLDAAVDVPGVNVAWQQQPHSDDSCQNDEPDYLVGIELLRDPDGYRARARAMDLVEGSRVSGFGLAWEGRLSRRQLAAYRETATDPAFRGSREVPYTADQSDLVARHLSHALSCQIFRGLDDDYVLALGSAETGDAPLAGTIELAARNLDASNAVVLTTNTSRATARVDGKAHRIAGALHQYWLSITPLGDGAIDSLSASVYIRMASTEREDAADPLPGTGERIRTAGATATSPAAQARIDGVMMPGDKRQRLIRPLAVYRAGSNADCRHDARRCTLLHTRAADDVIVFTLMHAPGRGLLQLAADGCRAHSAARVLTAGHSALFPVPDSGTRTRNVANGGRWLIEPETTTYYAVAVDNARDARRVAALVDRLPALCAGYTDNRFRGYALQQWLESLSHLMLELGPRAEWRAVEVNPV